MSIIKEDSAILLAYKKMFGLSNVDNTLDNDKVLNNAEIEELKNKLDLIGGTLIGNLFGTNATFTNDLTSNTSKTGITMVQLLELIQELKTQISSLSLTSSNLKITLNSDFPVKIPFSSSTIDQIIYPAETWTKSPYYFSTGSFRPFGMTLAMTIGNNIKYPYGREAISWGINRNTVNRDVWTNNWTVVTRVWYSQAPSGIAIKFGEKWDKWDNALNGNGNNGDFQTFYPDSNNLTENMYLYIPYPMSSNNSSYVSQMTLIETDYLSGLHSSWINSPDTEIGIFNDKKIYGGVYIIISYNTIRITIKLCSSNGTIYHSSKTNFNPLINDRRPFHIYSNMGFPIWYYGIVLSNTLNNNPIDDINMFKNQFSSIS
jgi:hypothetical protein